MASALQNFNVNTSFDQPVSSYLPNPSSSLNTATIGQANSQLFGGADLAALGAQGGGYIPQSNQGVSTDYRQEPGMMQNLLAPRAQAGSMAMQNLSGLPYQFANNNFQSLLGLQGANAGQAFGLGNIAQQLGQAGIGYGLGQFGGNLGFLQNLLGGIFGGLGGLLNGPGSGASSQLLPTIGNLGGGSSGAGIPGLTTG